MNRLAQTRARRRARGCRVMTDPLAVVPGNVIEIGNAAICACDPDPDRCHVYDTSRFNGRCPLGSEQAMLLAPLLKGREERKLIVRRLKELDAWDMP